MWLFNREQKAKEYKRQQFCTRLDSSHFVTSIIDRFISFILASDELNKNGYQLGIYFEHDHARYWMMPYNILGKLDDENKQLSTIDYSACGYVNIDPRDCVNDLGLFVLAKIKPVLPCGCTIESKLETMTWQKKDYVPRFTIWITKKKENNTDHAYLDW